MDILVSNNDIFVKKGDLEIDNSLRNAIAISLFTDARIDDDAEIPDRSDDRRGYWGDSLDDIPTGSLLWTLDRERITNKTLELIDKYVNDCLKWLIDDSIVGEIETMVERDTKNTDQINFEIKLIKPKKTEVFTYSVLWGQ